MNTYRIALTENQAWRFVCQAYREWPGADYWRLEKSLRRQGLFDKSDAPATTWAEFLEEYPNQRDELIRAAAFGFPGEG